MKQRYTYLIAAIVGLCGLVTMSCEDMFQKEVHFKEMDFPPRLAVTAALDTDDSIFRVRIYEGRSLSSIKNDPMRNEPKMVEGRVKLFEDGAVIYQETGIYNVKGTSLSSDTLPLKADATYRLEIDFEGYPLAVSEAKMPQAPQVSDAMLDEDNLRILSKVISINSLSDSYFLHSNYAGFPLSFRLADNGAGADYYTFKVDGREVKLETRNSAGHPPISQPTGSLGAYEYAVMDQAITQTNPDVESKSDLFLDEENTGIYAFGQMLFSDAAFAGTTREMKAYVRGIHTEPVNPDVVWHKEPVPNYNVHFVHQYDLVVTHLTGETFACYRAMAYQRAGQYRRECGERLWLFLRAPLGTNPRLDRRAMGGLLVLTLFVDRYLI